MESINQVKEAYLVLLKDEFECTYEIELSDEMANDLYNNVVLRIDGCHLIDKDTLDACKEEFDSIKETEKSIDERI